MEEKLNAEVFENLKTNFDIYTFQAYIVENAGGKASDGTKPILEIEPTGLHVRSPIFLGSSDDVDDILAIMEKHA